MNPARSSNLSKSNAELTFNKCIRLKKVQILFICCWFDPNRTAINLVTEKAKLFLVSKVWEITTPPTLCYKIPPTRLPWQILSTQ